jgi:acyl carrier protein
MAIIAKRLPPARQNLALEDRLDELGIDSIDAVEMVFDLEEKFDIEIPYNANDGQPALQTVGEIIDAITGLVGGKA